MIKNQTHIRLYCYIVSVIHCPAADCFMSVLFTHCLNCILCVSFSLPLCQYREIASQVSILSPFPQMIYVNSVITGKEN